ncbi:type II toxin-antitoxin system VapC family toxin [Hyphomonas sp.]|uniref:type II toxin-antitoxin system VapC family toxin n=1 Tax=Hyphomonas sp. TaxID=87 RepID=UPI001BCE23D6|nr:type II toxin-antitoxin system VapC family toxin [Hyphomonas sp.]
MILADSSIWIDHLHKTDARLVGLLINGQIQVHPHVIGELALGSIRKREEFLDMLVRLPMAFPASHGEVLSLVEQKKLYARGIGYSDAHLITSSLLTPGTSLWTRDRRLADVARELGTLAEIT